MRGKTRLRSGMREAVTEAGVVEALVYPSPRRMERRAGATEVPGAIGVDAGPHFGVVRAALAAGWEAVNQDEGGEARSVLGVLVREGEREKAWLRVSVDGGIAAELGKEGYRLVVTPDRKQGQRGNVAVTAAGTAGIRHALATLRQLVEQFGAQVPAVEIADGAALEVRGVMLDVSRNRVPTMRELGDLVERLALVKINHLQLYTEHTFAYAGHEEVWEGWSPLTGEEVRRLDALCAARGIELAANQNCFGHLQPWLKRERYRGLAEIEGLETVWRFYDWPRVGPFSLCPTDPKALEFVAGLLDQMLPCFSSGLVNINCDETADVGQGRSRGEVKVLGKGEVYARYVAAVDGLVRARGKRSMFWGDVALEHPGLMERLPKEMIALAWGYEPDSPFEQWGRALSGEGTGREFWMCPGTSSWRSITGRTKERRGNIDAALEATKKFGARGMLMCDWGDLGHCQTWPIAWHGILDGAQAAWTGKSLARRDGRAHTTVQRAKSLHGLGDRKMWLADWMDELGDVDEFLRAVGGRTRADGSAPPRLKNATVLFSDSLARFVAEQRGADGLPTRAEQLGAPTIPVGTKEEWERVEGSIRHLGRTMPAGLPAVVEEELRLTVRSGAAYAARGVLRRDEARTAAACGELAAELRGLSAEHRRVWLMRSRAGGLDESAAVYDGLAEELEALAR